ncbi:hypothetical protein [Nostoc sp.]
MTSARYFLANYEIDARFSAFLPAWGTCAWDTCAIALTLMKTLEC